MPIYSVSIVLYVVTFAGTGRAGVYVIADYTLHV